MLSPYGLMWKILLARNRMIFKEKEIIMRQLYRKEKSLTLETIFAKNLKKIDVNGLYVEERDFIGYLLDKCNSN